MNAFCIFVLLGLVFAQASADTPANCTYDDVSGTWAFYEGQRSSSNQENCTNFQGPAVYPLKIKLLFPNLAVDELGHKGTWTLIYNQGFEITINYRKYFAFSKYVGSGQNVTSYCNKIFPGWSHDVLGKNWACFTGSKLEPTKPKTSGQRNVPDQYFFQDNDFVRRINSIQSSWSAKVYPELDGMHISHILRRNGGLKSRFQSPSVLPRSLRQTSIDIPEEFDWRNVSGVNYVSPVRNQGGCGSCYSFSSMGMLESRLRIATNNTVQETFAPQDIVSCSEYAQGCAGGFPYLIAGKYAQDFGVVPEKCNPYTGKDGVCTTKQCKRYYVAHYNYVGGFYGGCNEENMKAELVRNGPIAVSFEVYNDFMQYSGGVYHHTGLQTHFDPFLITNHAVLAVGYGKDKKTGESYWIVKNSWGTGWGENGFFRIRRGTDECNIESIAVAATIIP